MIKIAVAGVVGALLLFYIMAAPGRAKTDARDVGHVATSVAHGVRNFIDGLTK